MLKSSVAFTLVLLFLGGCATTMQKSPESSLIQAVQAHKKNHWLEQSKPLLAKFLRQAWQAAPEQGFEPAYAELHAGSDAFWVFAALSDRDIYNSATGFNEKTWQTGDVFEIFIQTDADSYYEFHVTPENRNLFLAWTTESFAARGPLEEAMIQDPSFLSSETSIQRDEDRWTVVARIPYANLGIDPADPDAALKVAFARYDTGRQADSLTILSASPEFPRASFHLRDFWHPLNNLNQKNYAD